MGDPPPDARLKTFASLLAQGLITRAEFEAEQRKLQGESATVRCASCGATSPPSAERCFNCGTELRPVTLARSGAAPAQSPAIFRHWVRGPLYLFFVGTALMLAGLVILVGIAWRDSSFDFDTGEYRSNALLDFLDSLTDIVTPLLLVGFLVLVTSTVWNSIERRRLGIDVRAR